MVKSSADALLTVIDDVLDFSKIEAGKMNLEEIDFSLCDCLAETLKILTLRADEKSLELACDIDTGLPDRLSGDPGRLRQIIMNLVGNAIKFTEHGEVVVRVVAESQELGPPSTESAGGALHFMVIDTGIGIPPEKQTGIFQAFTQADGSTTRQIRRHRLGSDNLPAVSRDDGGPDLAGKLARQREHLPFQHFIWPGKK